MTEINRYEGLSQQAIAHCPEISPELAQEVDEALSEAGLHGFSVVLSLELAVFCNVNREKDYLALGGFNPTSISRTNR
ncbi:MAG: hypothetical protein ACQERW_04055 [Cyanobacteriota bacterium]|nr:MAG: hypothetical protein EYR95_06980 [Phormidium sp. SL48-SHIP]